MTTYLKVVIFYKNSVAHSQRCSDVLVFIAFVVQLY